MGIRRADHTTLPLPPLYPSHRNEENSARSVKFWVSTAVLCEFSARGARRERVNVITQWPVRLSSRKPRVCVWKGTERWCSVNCSQEFGLFGLTPCDLYVFRTFRRKMLSPSCIPEYRILHSYYHKNLKSDMECSVDMAGAEVMPSFQGRFTVQLFTYTYSLVNA
jgi:hypothetical protein